MNWISISERLPEQMPGNLSSDWLLISDGLSVTIGYYSFKYREWREQFDDGYEKTVLVSHWMPLPPPPRAD